MFDPVDSDIGRRVKYTASSGFVDFGYITSFNDTVVFVRYDGQPPKANGQATAREDLEFVD